MCDMPAPNLACDRVEGVFASLVLLQCEFLGIDTDTNITLRIDWSDLAISSEVR